MPNSIITDNGTNFTGHYFQEFVEGYGIRIDWASVGHPRTNGQVERAHSLILQGLKSRVFDMLKNFAGHWVEELPTVLWSLRTTPNRSIGLTPFFLTYGSEAVRQEIVLPIPIWTMVRQESKLLTQKRQPNPRGTPSKS